jgi:tetratricopeptide (TPR) repeat protein
MFFEKALESNSPWVQENADLRSSYSWCLSKLKRFTEEERQLRECLRIDPEYACQNDLGWSLYKQGKYQEALHIFDNAIDAGVDGKFPYYNRARTLAKLNRYTEALEAWKTFNPDGRLPSSVQLEIDRLQQKISRSRSESQDNGKQPGKDLATVADDQPDEEDDDFTSVEAVDVPIVERGLDSNRIASPKEILLEDSLERLINLGTTVFGRSLRIYQSAGAPYGRQYPIPGGRIDLLTEDLNTGELLVIELKKDGDNDDVLRQIATYMVWVRENIAKENQKVAGLICVFSASPKLRMAVRAVPGLELFEYGFSFSKI